MCISLRSSLFSFAFFRRSPMLRCGWRCLPFDEQAATQFKLAKMYEDAAACYQMQAGARTRLSEDMQACNALTSAFEMFAKSDATEEAYEAANTAIEKYKDSGKFDRAAKLLQKVAEVRLFFLSNASC